MVRTNRTINPPFPPPPFSHKNTKTEQKKNKKTKTKTKSQTKSHLFRLSAQIVPPRTTPLYTRRSDFVRTPEKSDPCHQQSRLHSNRLFRWILYQVSNILFTGYCFLYNSSMCTQEVGRNTRLRVVFLLHFFCALAACCNRKEHTQSFLFGDEQIYKNVF